MKANKKMYIILLIILIIIILIGGSIFIYKKNNKDTDIKKLDNSAIAEIKTNLLNDIDNVKANKLDDSNAYLNCKDVNANCPGLNEFIIEDVKLTEIKSDDTMIVIKYKWNCINRKTCLFEPNATDKINGYYQTTNLFIINDDYQIMENRGQILNNIN